MKKIYQFLLFIVVAFFFSVTSHSASKITLLETWTHVEPFSSYPVNITYSNLDASTPTFIAMVKNPEQNWEIYARKIVSDTDADGFISIDLPIEANAEVCDSCVWEVRALNTPQSGDEDYSDIAYQDVVVYLEDKLVSSELPLNVVTPGGQLSSLVRYQATDNRDLRIELIAPNTPSAYSSVNLPVTAGAGEVLLSLPISSALLGESSALVSIKLLPRGGQWFEFIDQNNFDVAVAGGGSGYFWDFPLETTEITSFFNFDGPFFALFAKVGPLTDGVYDQGYANILPYAGNQVIHTWSETDAPIRNGVVLDLVSGDLLRYRVDLSSGAPPTTTVVAYNSSGDNNEEYSNLLASVLSVLNQIKTNKPTNALDVTINYVSLIQAELD